MVPWSKSPSSETRIIQEYAEKTIRDPTYSPEMNDTHVMNNNNNNNNVSKNMLKEDKIKLRKEESKGSYRLKLGHYSSTALPLSILFFGFTCGTLAVSPLNPDPRVQPWFLMQSSVVCLAICVVYVVFSVVWGPRMMEGREPFKYRAIMLSYNAFQVVFSAYIFWEVGMSGWFFDYNYQCQPCNYSVAPKATRMANVGWLFFLSKILDFTDTLFFVLSKKWSNISLLHIVHHSCMCISMWFGIAYTPGGHITFMGFINSFVHIIMYTYYFLSAVGPWMRPYLWWKRYLTKIQLIQFVAIFIHAAQLFFHDCPTVPTGMPIWTCIYAFIFFALFMDFYYNAYKKNKSEKAQMLLDANRNVTITHSNGYSKEHINGFVNGHARSSSNLHIRLDSCLRERTTVQTT